MKRVVILSLVVLALLLLALLARLGRHEAAADAPPAEVAQAAPMADSPAAATESEDASAAVTAREPAERRTVEAQPTTESGASERTPAAPIVLETVRIVARDAHTLEPVRSGEVRIEYTPPANGAGWEPEGGDPASAPAAAGSRRRLPDSRAKSHSGTLDAEGRFDARFPLGTRVDSVTFEPPPVRARAAGARETFAQQRFSFVRVLSAGGLDLVLDVQRGAWIEGVVRDAETRLPVAGARLLVRGGQGSAESDERGQFVLGNITRRAGSTVTLDVTQREYLPLALDVRLDTLPGAEPFELELRRGLVVSGRLVDESGRALADVVLALSTSGGVSAAAPSASLFSARSNAQGEFRFGPIAPCRAATITVTPQEHGGAPVFGLERPLGALDHDRAGLELCLAGAGTIAVRVELASGSVVPPRDVHLCAPGAAQVVPGRIAPDGESRLVQVPLGVDLELVALARASAEASGRQFLHGSQHVRLDGRAAEALPLRIVLRSSASFELPPPPEGAKELALDVPGPLLGAFDVQLLEAGSGQALQEGRRVSLSGGGASLSTTKLVHGWLRVRARPGRHVFEAELEGGPRTSVECTIPLGGYARGEWRLEGGP